MTPSTLLLIGITGAAATWWLFCRSDYFVQLSGGSYEYFGDPEEARSFARSHSGAQLYQIPKGSEFDVAHAVRMTPNRSKKRRRKSRRR